MELDNNDPTAIKEVLDHIRMDPAWAIMWEHMIEARQNCLLRMAGVENWDQYLMLRGELNAINILLEWGDDLAGRLEQAKLNVEVDNGGYGRH